MGCLLYSTIITITLLIYGVTKKINMDDEQRRNSTLVLKKKEDEEMVNQNLLEKDYEGGKSKDIKLHIES